MKVSSVSPVTCEYVETDSDEYPTFVRYGADSWANQMGESLEPVYSYNMIEELEAAYREFKNAGT